MAWLAPYAYWAGICAFLGVTLYSEILDRGTTDDPLGDAADGDIPFIPQELKTLFHASHNITGRQQDHA